MLSLYGPSLTAAYASSYLTRTCNNLAFRGGSGGRSMLTSDMIRKIPDVIDGMSPTGHIGAYDN